MNHQISNNSVYDTTIRLFILLLIVAWCLLIMYPFVSIMLWSLILAMAIYPLHTKMTKKIGGKPKLASFIIIFSMIAIIFFPSWLLINSLVDEVKEIKINYDKGTLSIPPPTEKVKEWPIVGEPLFDTWQNAHDNLQQTILKHKDQLTDVGSKIAKGVLSASGGVIQIMAALIIAGIILVFGGAAEGIRQFFRKLADNRGDEFADIAMKTVGNVVKGVIGVALIMGLLHGILLMISGVPYAGLWSLIIFALTILQIPAIIVTLPIIIYLYAAKEPLPATIWSVLLLLAGLSDNFLKPILLGKGAPVPMLIIFIGVIGGFMLSGFIGLFTGAIVMSIGYKLFVGWINTSTPVDQG